ncbi:hypothetical protein [Mycolicibacter virginiensis]|uniref:hypothetical protein n=1 Tax=Mycolicibacter virginiensis TaxID=1795032 RepID=UPI001F0366E5|nr:hypothetical protein [Mycolicibacter virginiensis]ULP48057.1 hypothetical protein MJO54_02475 [Mycolicibacter virginiensis]
MSALLAVGDVADATSLLDRWQLFSAGAFLVLAFLVRGSEESTPADRDPHGPVAGRVAAQTEHNNSMASVLFAAAVTMLAWGLAGGGVGLIVGVAAGGFAATSFKRSDHAEEAVAGYDLAEQQWRRDQQIAAQNPIQPPDPYAHLRHLPIDLVPPPEPVVQAVPEPHLNPEQAAQLYRLQQATGGWEPRSGSAIAAVMSIDGQPDPAQAAILKVGRDLGWGRVITGEAGQRWEPWVHLVHVREINGGDAELVLQITHASIDEDTMRKHLPALLRALKVRDGQVDRDIHSGALVLTVTNEKPAAPAAETGDGFDPNWS